VAKERFLKDLQRAKDAEMAKGGFNEEEIKQIKRAKADALLAPNNGQVLFELSVEGPSCSPSVGTKYNQDEFFCYVSTPWGGFEKVHAGFTGRIVEICAQQGQMVRKGQPIAYLEREKE
jgi:pyruvate carboxylase subunit B